MQILAIGFLTISASCYFQGVSNKETEDLAVAAVVDGHSISVSRVERHLKKTLGGNPVKAQFLLRAKAEALEHLINRHVVLLAIKKSGSIAGESLVNLELSKLTDRLNEIDQSLPIYLLEINSTEEELLYEFQWRIAWKKYLTKHLTDERLRNYYKKHRRQFDGTQMKVAHLLVPNAPPKHEAAFEKAMQIKDAIALGKLSWNESVSKHSIATSSSSSGGEIGWVSYDGPMAPEFCHAAMQLENGQISAPVQSPFGIHLIKCLEIKPGKIGPDDARESVRKDAMRFLFNSISKRNRSKSNIDYSVDWRRVGFADQR